MKKNNKKENPRRAAYEARQAEHGKNVVKIILPFLWFLHCALWLIRCI